MSVEKIRATTVLHLFWILAFAGVATAQTNSGGLLASSEAETAPSFYADVLPVFQNNCVDCHRPNAPDVGGITAPMSLMTYAEAYRWAPRIKRALESGYMPPWGAHVQHKGTFKDERYIDDADKETVIAWVDAGAPEGETPEGASPSESATLLEDSKEGSGRGLTGWWIGEPDLVVGFE